MGGRVEFELITVSSFPSFDASSFLVLGHEWQAELGDLAGDL